MHGIASKSFHEGDVSVHVSFLGGLDTPLQAEGLTIDTVWFQNDSPACPIPDVPPRVFSEAMRDIDLVVSVAHRGNVDPEASASTIDTRARLLEEVCALLRIDNVRVAGNHAFITGRLGEYRVHFGSGVANKLPGGAVCIVPIHAQHRGRLFLPFADDDPKSAEVLAKILLLARDDEIQDPTILEQLRRG